MLVAPSDVLQASLRNTCSTTIPLQYGVEYVEDLDLQRTVKQLIDGILNQPYRGVMLRKLNDLFHDESGADSNVLYGLLDFQGMLASAVEEQGES